MTNAIIIHFAPIELYPPVQNLLHGLSKVNVRVTVITTTKSNKELRVFNVESPSISILRIGKQMKGGSIFSRIFNYFSFYSLSLWYLMNLRPTSVLYFETLSSFPACVYKRYLNKTVRLLVHYHEYTSPEQYKTGMRLEYYFHLFEMKIYQSMDWISHTNEGRMNHFLSDILPIKLAGNILHITPNYPPSSWRANHRKINVSLLKVVYVGALSLETMYTREFAQWILNQNGSVTWDIYSYNYSGESKEYLQELKSEWIRIHDGVNYDELPLILQSYHVGVILYNGHIPNYVMNAPNKLFEYLACGLDVWFPDVMLGSKAYVNETGTPKVLAIDFTSLKNYDLRSAMAREGSVNQYSFFCEDVLRPLIENLNMT